MPRPTGGNTRSGWKKPELTAVHRRNIFFTAVNALKDDKLPGGFFTQLSSNLPVAPRTVSVHWKQMRAKYEENVGPISEIDKTTMMQLMPLTFFLTNKKTTGQNARKWMPLLVVEALKEVPLSQRQTVRNTAAAMGMPVTTFFVLMKRDGAAVRHSSALKPYLTEENKLQRVLFSLSKIDKRTLPRPRRPPVPITFVDDMNEIVIDEKWFNLTHDGVTYYLAPDEPPPERRCKHKGYIDKIMFLCAIARPRKVNGVWWDGKLGIWAFGRMLPAQRTSVNRPAGTLEWKNENVDSETYRAMLMNQLVPTICTAWPAGRLRESAHQNPGATRWRNKSH